MLKEFSCVLSAIEYVSEVSIECGLRAEVRGLGLTSFVLDNFCAIVFVRRRQNNNCTHRGVGRLKKGISRSLLDNRDTFCLWCDARGTESGDVCA